MGDLAVEARAGIWWAPPDNQYPLNFTSIAYENAHVALAGSGRLYGFTVYSSRSSSQFILIFDATAIPATGAVPVLVFPIGAAAVVAGYWGSVGRWFDRGIVIANSSTGPTYTAGSADCWFDVQAG